MIRLLAVPVAGTIAALIAITVFNDERPEADAPDEGPPPEETRPNMPEIPLPDEPEPDDEPPPVAPPPTPVEYQLRLEADGSFSDVLAARRFDDLADVKESLATDERVRHRVFVENGEGVSEADLDAALEKLRETFDVRKVYTAPDDG